MCGELIADSRANEIATVRIEAFLDQKIDAAEIDIAEIDGDFSDSPPLSRSWTTLRTIISSIQVDGVGFYLDFVATVPGPLLRTTDEVAEALRDLDGVRSAHDARYAAFRETFCELDDGRAASRVVDCLLSAERNSTTANTLGNV